MVSWTAIVTVLVHKTQMEILQHGVLTLCSPCYQITQRHQRPLLLIDMGLREVSVLNAYNFITEGTVCN